MILFRLNFYSESQIVSSVLANKLLGGFKLYNVHQLWWIISMFRWRNLNPVVVRLVQATMPSIKHWVVRCQLQNLTESDNVTKTQHIKMCRPWSEQLASWINDVDHCKLHDEDDNLAIHSWVFASMKYILCSEASNKWITAGLYSFSTTCHLA